MYEQWADLGRALGDPIRLHILGLLKVRDACVCELVELLPVSQPAVSQHLRKLKYAGLVRDYRDRSWTFYALRADVPPAAGVFLEALPISDADVRWLNNHRIGESCAPTARTIT